MLRRPTLSCLSTRALASGRSPNHPIRPLGRDRNRRRARGAALPWALLLLGLAAAPASADELAQPEDPYPCEEGATLATGSPDTTLFARDASQGVRAFWCEAYDADGNARRAGAYWEVYPGGATRSRARYVDSRLAGPVEVYDEEGGIWLRGELADGVWTGPLEIFHATGARWFSAQFRAGQLDGPVETRYPDGSVESTTYFQNGREDGIATSYYPATAGGGLRSQVRVESDEIVENAPRAIPADDEGEADPSPIAHVSAEPER